MPVPQAIAPPPLRKMAVQQSALEPTPASGKLHVLTERTGKRYKLMQLVGVLMIIGGVSMLIVFANLHYASPKDHQSQSAFCIASIVIGLPLWIVGRFLAWWNHG